jgi:DNA (cytosine-5)-methyltransferase 1
LSLFSGIGGFDEGLRQAGCEIVACCEIDANCRQVLERHFPRVPIFTDIKQLTKQELINEGVLGDGKPIDLICGGFPCQDLSVAGNRAGLAGERSGLFFDFMRIVDAVSPRWVLIENVPGLLSSNGGRDMGTVIGTLAKLGYGYAYRTMDAQYFGVAQRRRRVFIVGHLGKPWSAPAKVLFEPESVSGNPAESRKAGQKAAGGTGDGAKTAGGKSVTATITATYGTKWNGNSGADTGDHFILDKPKANCLKPWDSQGQAVAQYQKTVGALCARDYKGVGSQYVDEGKCVVSASTEEGNAREILRSLREEIGAEAFTEWGSGILDSLQEKEILQSGVHGQCVCTETQKGEPRLDDGTLSCEESCTAWPLPEVRSGRCERCSPQGRELAEQRTEQPGKVVSELSHKKAQAEEVLLNMRETKQGIRILRKALSEIQEAWRPYDGKTKPTHSHYTVRRLTPTECERLMGFSDGWTEGHSDSARYRMLGNAVCMPVAKWLGERIRQVTGQ